MKHSELWFAIDSLACVKKMSCSCLARKSGLDATTFNKSKRWTQDGKPRWPSTQSLAKVLDSTNTSLEAFSKLIPRHV